MTTRLGLRLGLALGLALSAAVALPTAGCLGAPFTSGTGGGGGTSTTSSTNTGGTGVTCDTPQISCDGFCVDTSNDDAHCGSCTNVCKTGKSCVGGTCKCPAGLSSCNGSCVDKNTNGANCGTCGNDCKGNACVDGQCTDTCPFDTCNGVCTDTSADKLNCGNCDAVCAGATSKCTGSQCDCTITGESYCDGKGCFNTQNDTLHCGASCAACTGGKTCQSGHCACADDEVDCSGLCRKKDADNCSACNVGCPAGQTCGTNGCQCEQSTLCGGTCGDPDTNPLGCGTSSATCAACKGAEACFGGTCICQDPLTDCGGTCVDTDTDRDHCGNCDTQCNAAQGCENGSCTLIQALCGATAKLCNGICTPNDYFRDSPLHCGACNQPCSAGETCIAGVCHGFFVLPESCQGCDCPELCGSKHTCCQTGGNPPLCLSGDVPVCP